MTKSKTRTKPQRPSPPTLVPSSPSLLRQACRFLGTTAGLDLTLRLFQGLVLITANVAVDQVVSTRSIIAASQLDLARRYLRFFVLLDCIQNVLDALTKNHGSLACKTFDLLEWSCLLVYFTLENLTMLHDMKIHAVPWYTSVLIEANKFWFYAILASIARTFALRVGLISSTAKKGKQQQQQEQLPPLRRLVIDALDLTLPASFVGWLALDDATIGCLMTVSTVLVWRDVWGKAQ